MFGPLFCLSYLDLLYCILDVSFSCHIFGDYIIEGEFVAYLGYDVCDGLEYLSFVAYI